MKIHIIRNRAFGLIEVLIVTVILAVGLLGFAIFQQNAINLFRNTDNKITAQMFITEMINRMESNVDEAQKEINSTYLSSYTSVANTLTSFQTNTGDNSANTTTLTNLIALNCTYTNTNPCTSSTLAAIDLLEWKSSLKTYLPNGYGIVCLDNNIASNQNSLTCSGTNPGRSTSPKSVVYTIKVSWTDSTNTTQYLMGQATFPCGASPACGN
jgi:type IV pilus assembly protein PilV